MFELELCNICVLLVGLFYLFALWIIIYKKFNLKSKKSIGRRHCCLPYLIVHAISEFKLALFASSANLHCSSQMFATFLRRRRYAKEEACKRAVS